MPVLHLQPGLRQHAFPAPVGVGSPLRAGNRTLQSPYPLVSLALESWCGNQAAFALCHEGVQAHVNPNGIDDGFDGLRFRSRKFQFQAQVPSLRGQDDLGLAMPRAIGNRTRETEADSPVEAA